MIEFILAVQLGIHIHKVFVIDDGAIVVPYTRCWALSSDDRQA